MDSIAMTTSTTSAPVAAPVAAPASSSGGVWIGIDLGTTNCSVSVWDGTRGHPKSLRLKHLAVHDNNSNNNNSNKGGRIVPSVVMLLTKQAATDLLGDCCEGKGRAPYQDLSSILHNSSNDNNNNNNDNYNNIVAVVGAAAVNLQERLLLCESTTTTSTSTSTTASALCDYTPAQVAASLCQSVKRVFGVALENVDPLVQESLALTLRRCATKDAASNSNNNNHEQQQQQQQNLLVELVPLGTTHALQLSPVQLSAILLQALRQASNQYLRRYQRSKHLQIPVASNNNSNNNNSNINNSNSKTEHAAAALDCLSCVVGVPAHYGRLQREAVRVSCQFAGFTGHVSVLTESTAAAMAYGLLVDTSSTSTSTTSTTPQHTKTNRQKTILVLDMGGGTTDVTIAELTDRAQQTTRNRDFVVVTASDATLGGDTMDAALATRCKTQLLALQRNDSTKNNSKNNNKNNYNNSDANANVEPLRWDQQHQQRALLKECKRAKERLCGDVDGGMVQAVDSYGIGFQGYRVAVTQDDLEEAIRPCLDRMRAVIDRALDRYAESKDMERSKVQMQEVVLIGGATRVPAVRQVLRETFPPPVPPDLCVAVNAMLAVSQGAAIKAAMESTLIPMHELRSAMMLDAVPHAIGALVGEDQFVEILSKDASLPAKGFATFQLANIHQAGVTVIAVENIGEADKQATFSKLGEFTFLLHKLTPSQQTEQKDTRAVDIGMVLNEDGEFTVSVFDHHDPEHIRKKERYQQLQSNGGNQSTTSKLCYKPEQEEVSTEIVALTVACVILFLLYVAAKIMFQQEQTMS